MAALKIDAPPADLEVLWRTFDKDGSGSVDFKEMQREISGEQEAAGRRGRRRRRCGVRRIA